MLLAGKYLNVIQECGIEIRRTASDNDDDLSLEDDRCVRCTTLHVNVELCYAGSTSLLMMRTLTQTRRCSSYCSAINS